MKAPSEVLLFIIAVPWPDLSTGWNPSGGGVPGLKLLASKNDTRAWPGGFGYAKVGANYGPAFLAAMDVRVTGYDARDIESAHIGRHFSCTLVLSSLVSV